MKIKIIFAVSFLASVAFGYEMGAYIPKSKLMINNEKIIRKFGTTKEEFEAFMQKQLLYDKAMETLDGICGSNLMCRQKLLNKLSQ